jgi:hypothetical protein
MPVRHRTDSTWRTRGIAPGIRLSGYPSAESATQFSECRQFPNTARIEINTLPWDATPMSERNGRRHDSRFSADVLLLP